MTGPRKRYRNWICDPHADRHSRVGARWWGVDIGYGGEPLLIPINMRDGSLLCVGKGNEDWNCSAPHGAGRLMSRAEAKQSFTVSEFKKQMAQVYTTSVSRATLDECPMAYKGMQDILDNIGPTADVIKIIRPIYNFKAGDED